MTTPTLVVCDTPPMLEGKYEIQIISDGTTISQCRVYGTGCLFTVSSQNTPGLITLIPNSANPGGVIAFYADNKVSSTDQIDSLFIGPYRCAMNTLYDEQLPTILNSGPTTIQCNVGNIPAGYYSVSLHNLQNSGNAKVYPSAYACDENWNPFSFVVNPSITSINSNTGSPSGQIITIQGAGFGEDPTTVTASLDQQPCTVLSVTSGQLVCQLGPYNVPQASNYIGNAGLDWLIWTPQLTDVTLTAGYPNNANFTGQQLSASTLPFT